MYLILMFAWTNQTTNVIEPLHSKDIFDDCLLHETKNILLPEKKEYVLRA